MNRNLFAPFVAVLVLGSLACGLVNSAVDKVIGGGPDMKTVSQLWSDVPRMDGLQQSELEMPLFAKVMLRTMLNEFTGEGTNTGDWIAFSTKKTPDDVKNFYTNARMTANGWDASEKSTCLSGSEQGVAEVGIFCAFMKHQGNKEIALAIIAARDDSTKQTNIFFLRLEQIGTPVPKKAD